MNPSPAPSSAAEFARRARLVAASDDEKVPSPCLSVCRMEASTDLCEGCHRTLDEIAAWGRMTDGEKRAVWGEIARRIERANEDPSAATRKP